MPASPTTTSRSLARELADRWKTRWPLKLIGTFAFMSLFFWGYFTALHHPIRSVTIIPATWLDARIAFRPESLVFYVSLWIYVTLFPALLRRLSDQLADAGATAVLSAAGLAVFMLWPTAIIRPPVDWSAYPLFRFLQEVDASGNACPSLHAAFAVYTAGGFAVLLHALGAPRRWHAANVIWAVGILYSTLATKQHVALDLLGGVAYGTAGLALLGGLVRAFRGAATKLTPATVPAAE